MLPRGKLVVERVKRILDMTTTNWEQDEVVAVVVGGERVPGSLWTGSVGLSLLSEFFYTFFFLTSFLLFFTFSFFSGVIISGGLPGIYT